MKYLAKKLLSSGYGRRKGSNSLVWLLAFWILISASSQSSNAQLSSLPPDEGWIIANNWPYSYVMKAERALPVLLIVEQAGINLKVIDSDGSVSNSSQSRMGPEFILVDPEDDNNLILAPVYGNVTKGAFRIHTIPLDTPQFIKLARKFSNAGLKGGLFSQESMLSACVEYESLINDDGSNAQWQHIASTLLASCNLTAWNKSSKQQLLWLQEASLNDSINFYSIFSYQLNWLLARNHFTLQDYEKAENQFNLALEKAQALNAQTPFLSAAIEQDIAEIYSQYGDNGMMLSWKLGKERARNLLSQSEQRIKTAIRIAEATGNAQILGNAYSNLAGVLYIRGEVKETIEYMKLAESYLDSAGDAYNQIGVLGNMGDYYRRWGQLKAAQNAYNKAINLLSTIGDAGNHGHLYSKLSSLNMLFLDFNLAEQNSQIAIEFFKASGQERNENEMISQLASILREMGNYSSAREKRQQALGFFDEHEWFANALMAQAELSQDERLLGNTEHAYRLSLGAIKKMEDSNIGARVDRIPIQVNHAQLVFELGRHGEAIQQLQEVLLEVEKNGAEPANEILVLATLLEFYQQLGETENAISEANTVFNLIESQRVEFDSVRLGPRWSARTNSIFASHIEFLLQQSENKAEHFERAFMVTERARAVSLRQRRQEMMLNNNVENQAARSEWIDIVSQLQQSQGTIDSDEDQLTFERRLNEAQERYYAAHELSEHRQAPAILDSNQIRSQIPEDSMVLKYVAGAEKIWRFTLGRDHFSVTEIGDLEQVSDLTDASLQDLMNPNVNRRENLRQLSQILLQDVSLAPGVSRVLISPTSKMESVPFASLFYEERYFTEAAVLTTVPSLSEYFSSSPVTVAPERLEIAVLADPAFEPLPALDSYVTGGEQFRSWTDSRQRLPYSAIEAKDLARYFAEEERLILTGTEATEDNFFSKRVRSAKIIHIATHGYFNEELPELVGLAMAKANDLDDGFVSLAEIAAQHFSAELVVISACDTGRGFEVPGEGALSLSRSFLAQGVDSVVSTLWPVSDAATALFMKEFYRGLLEEKLDAAESLQQAQQALRKNPRYRNPFYWGAYVLTSAT